jgi:hypothetical protein
MRTSILPAALRAASPFVGNPRPPDDSPSADAVDDEDMSDMPLCPKCGHFAVSVRGNPC